MSEQETGLVPAGQQALEKKPEAQAGKLSRLGAFTPTNLTEAIALSKLIAGSELAPKDYKGKPANVLIAMQMGAEVGLAPMQALQNIAVINGRPSLWGDAALGIVQVSPMYEGHKEWTAGEGDSRTAYCQVKRKGQEAYTVAFTVAQAKKASLWGKQGPWQNYPDRMLQMRARGFALRDKFSDALRGLILAEEAMDIPADVSDAKKQREAGTLEMSNITSTLTPSVEQNRGHEDTGLQKTNGESQEPKKSDAVMCGHCSQIDGHTDDCPHKAKTEQEKKTSRPTNQVRMTISGPVTPRSKTNYTVKDGKRIPTTRKWLEVPVLDEQSSPFTLYVWSESLGSHLVGLVQGILRGEVSDRSKDGNTYRTLEHILTLNGKTFVNDEPVDADGEMDAGISASDVGSDPE